MRKLLALLTLATAACGASAQDADETLATDDGESAYHTPMALDGRFEASRGLRSFRRDDATGRTDFYDLDLYIGNGGEMCSYSLSVAGIDCGEEPCPRADMDDPANRSGFEGTCMVDEYARELRLTTYNGTTFPTPEVYKYRVRGSGRLELTHVGSGYRNTMYRASGPSVFREVTALRSIGQGFAEKYASSGSDNNTLMAEVFVRSDVKQYPLTPLSSHKERVEAAKTCAFMREGAYGEHIGEATQRALAEQLVSRLEQVSTLNGAPLQFVKIEGFRYQGDIIFPGCGLAIGDGFAPFVVFEAGSFD